MEDEKKYLNASGKLPLWMAGLVAFSTLIFFVVLEKSCSQYERDIRDLISQSRETMTSARNRNIDMYFKSMDDPKSFSQDLSDIGSSLANVDRRMSELKTEYDRKMGKYENTCPIKRRRIKNLDIFTDDWNKSLGF